MRTKTVRVLWSGGVDSTYLIKQYLDKGYAVYAGYIKITNNETKSKMELAAIEKLSEYFKEKYSNNFTNCGVIAEMELKDAKENHLSLNQPLLFLTALSYNLSYEEIAIGYIMGDDAVSYIPDLQKIWKSFSSLMISPLKPKLVFPLIKEPKWWIWGELPIELKRNVVWCEDPIIKNETGLNFDYSYSPCNECHSCKKHIYENIKLEEIVTLENLKVKV